MVGRYYFSCRLFCSAFIFRGAVGASVAIKSKYFRCRKPDDINYNASRKYLLRFASLIAFHG